MLPSKRKEGSMGAVGRTGGLEAALGGRPPSPRTRLFGAVIILAALAAAWWYLAMPYEVEAAIEGVCGQLRARWYERILFGQDHFALEIHYTTQAQVAFTLAAPARAVPALRAALENLYPDVQLERVAAGPDRP